MTTFALQAQRASCECGACSFRIRPTRATRFICHCRICQAYSGRAHSDVIIMRANAVDTLAGEDLVFRKYRPPPNISRGLCRCCGKPAIEFGGFGPARIAFVPTANLLDCEALPPVAMHIFYHRRKEDAADSVPKHEGYLLSELAFVRLAVHLF